MKKLKYIYLILFMSLVFLVGCSTEENISYSYLTRIGIASSPDVVQHYIISPPDHVNKLIISYPSDHETGKEPESFVYDLEGVAVTEEEIVIAFEGEEIQFERLSSSVAIDENDIRYQFEVPEQEEGAM